MDDLAFQSELVNCSTKVFVSIAEINENRTCATPVGDAKLNVMNVAPYDGGISLIIYLGNTSGHKRTRSNRFTWFYMGLILRTPVSLKRITVHYESFFMV